MKIITLMALLIYTVKLYSKLLIHCGTVFGKVNYILINLNMKKSNIDLQHCSRWQLINRPWRLTDASRPTVIILLSTQHLKVLSLDFASLMFCVLCFQVRGSRCSSSPRRCLSSLLPPQCKFTALQRFFIDRQTLFCTYLCRLT